MALFKLFNMNKFKERDNHFFEIAILGAGQHNKSAIKMLLIHSFKWNDDRDIPDNLMDLRAVVECF